MRIGRSERSVRLIYRGYVAGLGLTGGFCGLGPAVDQAKRVVQPEPVRGRCGLAAVGFLGDQRQVAGDLGEQVGGVRRRGAGAGFRWVGGGWAALDQVLLSVEGDCGQAG